MRTEKELFELMLSRQDLFETGICHWIISLWYADLITKPERTLMFSYIKLNKGNYFGYWWEDGLIEPRIEWIKQQIEKL